MLDSGGTSPTSQGVSIFYQSGSLVNAFKRRNTAWRTEAKEIDLDIWYHVAITWSDADGARMYIDGCLREHSFTEIPMEFTDAETPFYIGKSNSEVRDEHQELAMDDMYIFEEFKDAKFVKEFYIQYWYGLTCWILPKLPHLSSLFLYIIVLMHMYASWICVTTCLNNGYLPMKTKSFP